jgi:hypothetical protein
MVVLLQHPNSSKYDLFGFLVRLRYPPGFATSKTDQKSYCCGKKVRLLEKLQDGKTLFLPLQNQVCHMNYPEA